MLPLCTFDDLQSFNTTPDRRGYMKKILIIDDEEKVLTVLNRMLGHLGYESDAADNWEDGLARYGKGEFDLVMLDVHIPGRDGFNVARAIKEKNPGQKIIDRK